MSRGLDRERAWCKRKRADGWWAERIAGSRGPVDVFATKPRLMGSLQAGSVVHFYQVKSDIAGPYAHFGPHERTELRFAARAAGAEAYLVWWPPRKEPKVIPERDWPDDRPILKAA